MQQVAVTNCDRCGGPIEYGQLVCPRCGSLVYHSRLDGIATDALRLERVNPPAAAMIWREALPLLPSDSPQYAQVRDRIGVLASGWPQDGAGAAQQAQPWAAGAQEIPQPGPRARAVRPPDPLPVALAKTVGSMLVSILVYYVLAFQSLPIAVGFVVLMLVHEMGHVLAMRYYGLSASPPIFIPFIGALINLRESPQNALVESVVGIGGPLLGTLGALVCYALSFAVGGLLQQELVIVTQLAIILNLFNLLPVPPLDGGRVAAAITPWLWIPGLAGLFAFMVLQSGLFGLLIPFLILLYAVPRIRATLRAQGMNVPYYNIPRSASIAMGVLYVALAGLLTFLFLHLGGLEVLRSG